MHSYCSQHVQNAPQNIFVKCSSSHQRWSAVFMCWNVAILCFGIITALHWRHNDHDGVSNHQPHGCLLNRLFRRRWKKTSMLRVTGLCVGNSPDRWIPRTWGRLRGKCFHLMTSSWYVSTHYDSLHTRDSGGQIYLNGLLVPAGGGLLALSRFITFEQRQRECPWAINEWTRNYMKEIWQIIYVKNIY